MAVLLDEALDFALAKAGNPPSKARISRFILGESLSNVPQRGNKDVRTFYTGEALCPPGVLLSACLFTP